MEEDFWIVTGDLKTKHHQVPRKTLYMPKAADFPLPLEYVDIFRTTYTDLETTKEKKIKDYWTAGSHVDEEETRSNCWKGSTQFVILRPRPKK